MFTPDYPKITNNNYITLDGTDQKKNEKSLIKEKSSKTSQDYIL